MFVDGLPSEADTNQLIALNRQYAAGSLSKDKFLRDASLLTGQSKYQIEGLLDNEIVKNHPLLAYIALLKSQYKIGLLSNVASNWVRDTFLTMEEQMLFDEMVFSYQVGMVKPDPRIFHLTCERLRVAPEETIMVDDTNTYVEAASKVGMKGLVYDSTQQLQIDIKELAGASDGVSSLT